MHTKLTNISKHVCVYIYINTITRMHKYKKFVGKSYEVEKVANSSKIINAASKFNKNQTKPDKINVTN